MKTITWLVLLASVLTAAGCAMTEERYFAQRAAITCDLMFECDSPNTEYFDSKLDCQAQLEEDFLRGWELAGSPCDFDPAEADICIGAMRVMDCEYADPEYLPEECADVWICD